jgi:hypothetical protein
LWGSAALLAAATPARGDQPLTDDIQLDGLTVLASWQEADASSAQPVLLTDVEFEAFLLQIERGGPSAIGTQPDEELLARARRRSVFVKLLAQRARQLGESSDPREAVALHDWLVRRAGGPRVMAEELLRFGMDDRELRTWCRDAVLAAQQVRYARDQLEPIASVSEREERLGSTAPAPGRPLRTMVERERLIAGIAAWLDKILEIDQVRILR